MDNCFCVDSLSPNSSHELGEYLYIKLKDIFIENRPIIFLCIGTDRATGDSLGPLIGYKLKNIERKNIYIYGSLEYPVHSINLAEVLNKIKTSFINPFIIGIDASLGSVQNIGKVFIEDSPLHPGLALDKDLPEVGEMNIKGVVNISGNLDFMMLQNTRLFVVMSLADCISNAIIYFINNYFHIFISNILIKTINIKMKSFFLFFMSQNLLFLF